MNTKNSKKIHRKTVTSGIEPKQTNTNSVTPEFMEIVEKITRKYHNALKELANR